MTELNYQILKQRQRAERDNHSDGLALRVHRALSWLKRSELCDDEDGRFVFLWIAFNAAYSNENGMLSGDNEIRRYARFLEKINKLDKAGNLSHVVWQKYPNAIRVLLDNQYVFQPYWKHLHHHDSDAGQWKESFEKAKKAANIALATQDTTKVLEIVFDRLYTLRNQIIHGGATFNSSVNRDQMRDATDILGSIVPLIIEVMLDNANGLWGDACYPPQ